MKLTPAEYKFLDALQWCLWSISYALLNPYGRRIAKRLLTKRMIARRAWLKGYVVATALGKRSHARGKS